MILTNRLRRFSVMVAASAFAAVAFSAQAQEIGESHLKAAHAAISAIHATDSFDSILPQAAAALKQQLIQQNPDMQEVITQTVDEKALALAARRADLEKEAAIAYAKCLLRARTERHCRLLQFRFGQEAARERPDRLARIGQGRRHLAERPRTRPRRAGRRKAGRGCDRHQGSGRRCCPCRRCCTGRTGELICRDQRSRCKSPAFAGLFFWHRCHYL
jgi:hypothetical protein